MEEIKEVKEQENEIKETVSENTTEEQVVETPKRRRRKKEELNVEETNVVTDVEETNEKSEETKQPEIEDKKTDSVEKKPYITVHKFAPGDNVWFVGYDNKRKTFGYTEIVNRYEYCVINSVIQKVIIEADGDIKKVRYTLKRTPGSDIGSLVDEDYIFWTEEEANEFRDMKSKSRQIRS